MSNNSALEKNVQASEDTSATSAQSQCALNTSEYCARTIIRVIAIVASIYGMTASWEGLKTFTYFTNLSNVMICVALAGSLLLDTASFMRTKNTETSATMENNTWLDTKSNAWYVFKFMMTISIAVTFTLYLCFLAPTNKLGFVGAYMNNGCSSLCVHAVTPLLAIADFVLFDYRFRSTNAHLLASTIPPLTYVAYADLLGAFAGVRWGDHAMRAPYNFLNYDAPAGWFGFAPHTFNATTLGVGVAYLLVVFTLIFIGVGKIFLVLKDARARSIFND